MARPGVLVSGLLTLPLVLSAGAGCVGQPAQSPIHEAGRGSAGSQGRGPELVRPQPGQVVSPPLRVEGRAPGSWFFEGDAPARLLGEEAQLLAEGVATVDGPWMTEAMVPFTAELTFTVASPQEGRLVLEKDNASGRPELDASHTVPLQLEPPQALTAARRALSERLGTPPRLIRVASIEQVDWPNACLGVERPGQMCLMVITPGYRIVLEARDETYEYHTDRSGDQVVLARGHAGNG